MGKSQSKSKNPYKIDLLISISLIAAICMMCAVTLHFTINIHDQHIADDLRNEIKSRNVSDDYRNGFVDCLDRFEEEWNKCENMISNVSELMD